MSKSHVPGTSLLYRIGGWLVLLMLLPAVAQVLVAELLEWVEAAAPWLLGGLLIAAAMIVLVRLMRHRFFY